MAHFYNRKTGQYWHSHDSSVFSTGKTPQMRNKLDAEGKLVRDAQGTPEQELEPASEATGSHIMKTGTIEVDRTDVDMEDVMMNPDKSEIWMTSRNLANRGVPQAYWKPASDGSNKIVEMTDAEKDTLDQQRDIKAGKTEFNGGYYAFIGDQRTNLIYCHTIRNEIKTVFPMEIKSSDNKVLSLQKPELETLYNNVFGPVGVAT